MKYELDQLKEILDKMVEYVDPDTNIISLTSAEICTLAGLTEYDAELIDYLVNLIDDDLPVLLHVEHAFLDFFILNPALRPIKGEMTPVFKRLFEINLYKEKEKE